MLPGSRAWASCLVLHRCGTLSTATGVPQVTTEDPGVAGLLRSSSSDVYHGIRVAIGGSSTDWWVGLGAGDGRGAPSTATMAGRGAG